MKKTHCQPGPSVSAPPIRTPAAAPEPPIAAHTPSALLRSVPWKVVVHQKLCHILFSQVNGGAEDSGDLVCRSVGRRWSPFRTAAAR
jgi:hypothetical protein